MTESSAPKGENTSFIIMICVVATIGGFLFGFDSGVINGTVSGLQVAFESDSAGTGFSVASMLLGCAVGAGAAGQLADAYGRKSLLIVAAVFFAISAWGSGVAGTSGEFIVYRILGGMAVGAASVMTPAYISEVTPARFRGRMSTVQQVAIITGLTLAFFSNYFLAGLSGSALNKLWLDYETWRWMFWIELIPAATFLVALLAIPESPRFLVAKGRKEDAMAVLTKLYGSDQAKITYEDIYSSLAKDHHKPKLSDLYDKKEGRLRPIMWVGIGLAVFQQLVGINVVFYYGAVLWQAVGFSENDALLINVVSGILSIASCFAAIALVDKLGRKPLLWIGSAGMALTLALVAFSFSTGHLEEGKLVLGDSMGVLALVSANLYVMFFNFSWGPVMWVMLGEMFPNQIRGSGLAVAGFFQWVANFLVTMSFPIFLTSIGLAVTYSIYAAFALLSVFFVIKMVHETKGVALEDMEG